MIELSVAGPLLAKSEGQVWEVRARTKEGIAIREGTFRQMVIFLLKNLTIDAEELEAAVSFMLENNHDVAFFDKNRKVTLTYSSKTRSRMDK